MNNIERITKIIDENEINYSFWDSDTECEECRELLNNLSNEELPLMKKVLLSRSICWNLLFNMYNSNNAEAFYDVCTEVLFEAIKKQKNNDLLPELIMDYCWTYEQSYDSIHSIVQALHGNNNKQIVSLIKILQAILRLLTTNDALIIGDLKKTTDSEGVSRCFYKRAIKRADVNELYFLPSCKEVPTSIIQYGENLNLVVVCDYLSVRVISEPEGCSQPVSTLLNNHRAPFFNRNAIVKLKKPYGDTMVFISDT